jgi:dTDP-4-dehydrorhamnose 3,5-epimerase
VTDPGAVEGVSVTPLKQIRDDRGAVMHMLRADSPQFERFGEVYFSFVKRGVVKAWKRHRAMTQNFAVPVGAIRLVVYDDREGSATHGRVQEIETGADHYALVRIPPLVWYGFQGTGEGESMIANCASLPHDPAESESVEWNSGRIPYRWTP